MNRKSYAKPTILVEDFRISNYVAGCGTIVSNINLTDPTTDGCLTSTMQYTNTISGWFIDALGCTTGASSGDGNDGYCYFTYANSIFTS